MLKFWPCDVEKNKREIYVYVCLKKPSLGMIFIHILVVNVNAHNIHGEESRAC